jgi:hypothetical protein
VKRKTRAVGSFVDCRYLTMFLKQFNHVGDEWINSLKSVADGKTSISMHDLLCRVTSDALAQVYLSFSLSSRDKYECWRRISS